MGDNEKRQRERGRERRDLNTHTHTYTDYHQKWIQENVFIESNSLQKKKNTTIETSFTWGCHKDPTKNIPWFYSHFFFLRFGNVTFPSSKTMLKEARWKSVSRIDLFCFKLRYQYFDMICEKTKRKTIIFELNGYSYGFLATPRHRITHLSP